MILPFSETFISSSNVCLAFFLLSSEYKNKYDSVNCASDFLRKSFLYSDMWKKENHRIKWSINLCLAEFYLLFSPLSVRFACIMHFKNINPLIFSFKASQRSYFPQVVPLLALSPNLVHLNNFICLVS